MFTGLYFEELSLRHELSTRSIALVLCTGKEHGCFFLDELTESPLMTVVWFVRLYIIYSSVRIKLCEFRLLNKYSVRTAAFWAIAQRVVVILYHVLGQPVGPVFKVWRTLKTGPLKLGPIGCPRTWLRITTARCVIAQKGAVLIHFAAVAWNHTKYSVVVQTERNFTTVHLVVPPCRALCLSVPFIFMYSTTAIPLSGFLWNLMLRIFHTVW